jgi:hypothetical protein
MRSSYEQLIEFIINDETEKAKELFHNLVVEKSRNLYNELVAEEMEEEVEENWDHDMDEAGDDMDGMSMDQTDDMMHDIEADHDGMDHDGNDDMDMDMDTDGDMGHEEGEDGMEDRVMDLEDALDELKAEFEKLMADEKDEPEHHDGKHDPDFAEEGVVREYVEKVASPGNSEGMPVGAVNSYKSSTQKKSVVASKNDMGGTAKNLAQGDRNEDPDGKAYKGPSNEYSKGEGKVPGADKFLNAPGGDAGKKGFSNAKKPQSAEGKFATGGGPNVNKKDVLPR